MENGKENNSIEKFKYKEEKLSNLKHLLIEET